MAFSLVDPLPLAAEDPRIWPPPDALKRANLLSLFHARGHGLLIESGTYLGGTVEAFLDVADAIVSIEIEPELHRQAKERFAHAPHVEIVLGDATEHVPALLSMLTEPPLLFLDGHFSHGNTGMGDEVEPAPTILDILGRLALPEGLTIVVDDLRLFGSDPEFPSLDALLGSARRAFPQASIYGDVDSLVILA